MLGHRIAEESIGDLLKTLKSEFEKLYAEQIRRLPEPAVEQERRGELTPINLALMT